MGSYASRRKPPKSPVIGRISPSRSRRKPQPPAPQDPITHITKQVGLIAGVIVVVCTNTERY
jgi:hypothetical protein